MERQKLGDPDWDRESNGDAGEMERQRWETDTRGRETQGLGARWRQKRNEERLKVSVLEKSLQPSPELSLSRSYV